MRGSELVDPTNNRHGPADLLFDDERVREVGRELRVPRGAQVVEPALERAVAGGAIGVKTPGGHLPFNPDTTAAPSEPSVLRLSTCRASTFRL